MNKKKLFLILALSVILLAPVSLVQAAACTWRQEMITTNPELGTSQTTGGCITGENRPTTGSVDTCSGAQPATTNSFLTTTRSICCCGANTSAGAVTTKAPKFEIPELQIKLPGLNFSQPQCLQGVNGEYICKVNWLGEYMTWIYDYGMKVAGILAAIMLMAGGLLWLVSGGDAGKVGQAKEIITGSIVGLVILMSSYILLVQVNPNLVKFRPISIGALSDQQVSDLIDSKNSGSAEAYKQAGCATDSELEQGTTFYATGYCRPAWSNTKKFFCAIAMNCSCPGGKKDTTQNCDEFFPNNKNYQPCAYFDSTTEYCGKTASGAAPYIGSIAGPKCDNLPFGSQVCFNNTTYKVTDVGGAIEGKRIDIWTGDCSGASKVTGTGTLTKGPCGTGQSIVYQSNFKTAGWSFDPGIIKQAGDVSPDLGQLLNCMRAKLPNGVGTISSLSDSSYIGNLGVCNSLTSCTKANPKCAHSCSSCHYGGGSFTATKSYAVDFGDEQNKTALIKAATECDLKSYVLDEGNHLHVSVAACRKD